MVAPAPSMLAAWPVLTQLAFGLFCCTAPGDPADQLVMTTDDEITQ
jgi:hypothetical protein